MDPLYLLLISGLVAALITWRLLIGSQRISRNERRAAESLQTKAIGSTDVAAIPRPRYRAMSLRICNNPCPAAIRLRTKSFLVDAVPQLPLPGCDRACYCEYANHDDRRVRDDRRYPSEDMVYIQGTTLMQDDGRKGQDRRHRVEPYQGIY